MRSGDLFIALVLLVALTTMAAATYVAVVGS